MDRNAVITGSVALVLIVAVVAGGYWYFGNTKPKALPVDTTYANPAAVSVEHTVSGGVHIYSGSLPMTETCNTLGSGLSADVVRGAYETSIALGILKGAGPCRPAEQGATIPFKLSFEPERDLPVKLVGFTVNGQAVRFEER